MAWAEPVLLQRAADDGTVDRLSFPHGPLALSLASVVPLLLGVRTRFVRPRRLLVSQD